MKFCATLLLWLVSISAHAQSNGTIIILEITSRGLFIASDSRSSFNESSPEDDHCKLVALNQNSVFASASSVAYGYGRFDLGKNDPAGRWDAIHEAKQVVGLPSGRIDPSNIDGIADECRMVDKWKTVKFWHPEQLKIAEIRGKGALTVGIFASAANGVVAVAVREIHSSNSILTVKNAPVAALCANESPCGAGELDILLEFGGLASERAKRERLIPSPELARTYDHSLIEVIRLVDHVGGPIDALGLSPDGRITWFQKKNDCPENHR
jgi:hypothetical protein